MQNMTAAPGEMVEFVVMAIDQAGNPQEAIWSVSEKSEDESDFEVTVTSNLSTANLALTEMAQLFPQNIDSVENYFGSLAEGITHALPVKKVNKDVYYAKCVARIPRLVTFTLVQAIAGNVVYKFR